MAEQIDTIRVKAWVGYFLSAFVLLCSAIWCEAGFVGLLRKMSDWMTKSALTIGLLAMLFLNYILFVYIVDLGRKVELSKEGCTVSFLFIKRRYAWEEYRIKKVEEYYGGPTWERKTPYKEGVIFSKVSVKRPSKYRPEKPYLHSFHEAFFTVWICFQNEMSVKKMFGYQPLYDVDRNMLFRKMEEWGIELEQPEKS